MDERVASGGMPSNGHKPASANGQRGNGPAPAPPARKPRRALKNWSVRSRLLLLVIIPVAAAVALGAIRIASSVQSGLAYQRIHQLADLSQKTTGLAQALQTERQDTVKFIVLGGSGGRAAALSSSRSAKATAAPELQVLRRDYTTSDNWASQVKQQARSAARTQR